ncbi:MAG: sigma-70 family RNA polymerase sigma factor [Candidatus Marinimicrobia bacterium]|nr:sigma-70 family RNA polymerase sigma factor [Candidatus Neomarinimicrobiota bacterium]
MNELLDRARAGDLDAFAALFEPLRGKLRAVAWRLVGPADAEDIVMDTFLKAWQALPGFDGRSALATWLYRIARNRALDWRRRQQARPAESFDAGDYEDHDPRTVDHQAESPAEAAARADDQAWVRRALDQLPQLHRQIVLLHYVDGLRYHEIAAALDLPQGTVMSRLFHARRKLRALLTPDPREEPVA